MSESEDARETYGRDRRWITTTSELAECVLNTLDDVRRRRRILGPDSNPRDHQVEAEEQGVTR